MKNVILLIFLFFQSETYFAQFKDTVFVEEFFSNENKWPLKPAEGLEQKIENGKYLIFNTSNSGWKFTQSFNLNMSLDFSLEARIRQVSGSDNTGFGLIWGWSSWDNYTEFSITTNGYFIVSQKHEGKSRKIKPYTKIDVVKPMGSFNDLKIEMKSGRYYFYVNNTEVFTSDYSCSSEGSEHGVLVWQSKNIEVENFMLRGKIRLLNELDAGNFDYTKENLGSNVNSKFAEICPLVSPSGKYLFINRTGDPSTSGGEQDQEIFYCEKQSDGTWSKALNVGKPLNNSGPNFVVSCAADENTLVVANRYNADGTVKGQGLSLTTRTKNGWSIPEDILIDNFLNNDDYVEYCMSADQNILISSIESNFTYGARDLYVSFKIEDRHYSEPLNLGSIVNTNSWEMTPFLAADNKTLYFSSRGHSGYGNSDLYVVHRLDDTWKNWSQPKNLGKKINTDGDEMYFTIPASGEYAYMIKFIEGSSADIVRLKVPDAARPDPIVMIKGKVINKNTNQPLEAEIRYYELGTNKEIGSAKSNPSTGEYNIILQYGRKYSFLAEKSDFFAVNDNLDLSKLNKYEEIQRDLFLVPIEIGSVISLKNIFFDFNKADLKSESFSELDRLISLLSQNKNMEIEISGHTDNVGADDYNLRLSQSRVESVTAYLVKSGISKGRIKAVGYGETKPVSTNDTEDGKSLNRRVEFTILKK